MQLFIRLGLALVIGFLIGLERGWHEREAQEGTRIAGIRTFGLISLLGGLWSAIASELGTILLGFAFVAFAGLLVAAHIMDIREDKDVGITTAVASLVTFALGALVVQGYLAIAAASAVITATILSLKPVLHRWLMRLELIELYAVLKLLLISVVILPVLPNKGFGPLNSLNPYHIWWMVVLIAGLSFIGYFAIKIGGQERGVFFTSLFGGLVSSTVVTINFARMIKNHKENNLINAGVLVGSATMFPRMLVIAGIVNIQLLSELTIPLGIMGGLTYFAAFILWYRNKHIKIENEVLISNPFQLMPAIKFGLLLTAIMVLSAAFRYCFGETGLYILSGISGLADVDAITLSISHMTLSDLSIHIATYTLFLAAIVNTLVKAILFNSIAGWKAGYRILLILTAVILSGAVSLLVI